MRTRLRSKATLLFVVCAALLAVGGTAMALTADPSGTTAPAPTIQSDKDDYAPGETVTLTGSNWQPGESVHINVNDDSSATWSRDVDVTADANGGVQDQFQLPDWLVATYKVTATGAQSGVATTTFTDGNIVIQARPSSPSGTTFNGTFTEYNGTNCTGTVTSSTSRSSSDTPPDPVGSVNSNDFSQSVPNTSSLKIEASAYNSLGNGFQNFTAQATADSSLIIQDGSFDPASSPQIICINGNFTSGKTFFVNYFPNNQAPVNSVPGAQSTNEDTALTFNTTNNNKISISDPDAAPTALLRVSLVAGNGTLTLSGTTGLNFLSGDGTNDSNMTFTGTLSNINAALNGMSFTPNANFNGSAGFSITTDDQGSTGTGGPRIDGDSVNINVTAVNDDPVANNGTKTVTEDSGPSSIDLGALASDVETSDANLTYNIVQGPTAQQGTLSGTGSTRTFTPAANFNGSFDILYTVKDRGDPDNCGPVGPNCTAAKTSNQGKVTVTVTPVNDKPTADAQTVTTPEDTAKDITLVGNDVDGDSLTYDIVAGPAHGHLTGSGATRTYTPANNYHGPDSFTFKVNDGTVDSEAATVSITVTPVNDKPTADAQSVTTDEDVEKTITLVGNDVDGDSLTYDIVAGPAHGQLSGSGNTRTYTPANNYHGPDSFTFKVNDGTVDSDTAEVSITVTPVNDKPTADNQSVTTDEDVAKPITLTGNDVDGDSLTYHIVAGPTHGSLSGSGANLTYTPAADYNGPDSFTFKTNDGTIDSDVATVSITVTAVNDAPVAVDDTATTAEDTPVEILAVDLFQNDSTGPANESDQTLRISAVSGATDGSTAEINDAGNVLFTPALNFNGPASFNYTVCDSGTPEKCYEGTATVLVTVSAVNDAPLAEDQPVTTAEDTAKDITLGASDVENDTLSYTIVSGPQHGTLSGTDANRTYTPNANYNGPDSFTFKANDGTDDSNVATVSITVTPVNDKPTADNQSVTTDEDVAKPITLTGNDVDGDSLTYHIVAGPTHGSLSGSGANLTYTPAADYNGPDSFTFKTNDGTIDSDVATVSITVNSVNDKPVVTNLQGADTANEGDLKTYTFDITDADSSNFSFAASSPSCGAANKGEVVSGTAQITGNSGTFQCKFLDGGATATQVSVSAQVTDGQASSEAASKNVAVSNVAPKIESLTGPAQVLTNQPVTFTGAHSDPAGLLDNPFTWQWSGGTSTDTDKNNSYVTKFSACGPQTVKATVTDKDGGTSAEATLSTPVQAYNGNFLPPLQMAKDNLVQKGQVVPVKITVAGCDGLNLAGLNPYIQLFSGDPTTAINEADFVVPTVSVSSADTGQNMRPVSDGYIYNLRVPSDSKATVGAKYYIRVSPFGVASGQHMIISIQIRK